MKTPAFWTTAILSVCVAVPLSLSAAGSVAADRARSHQALNLARSAAGATLEVQLPGKATGANPTASNALLREDEPLGFALPAGSARMIISLPKIEVLNRFNFLNLSASGQVSVAVASSHLAADSPKWRDVQRQDFADPNSIVMCDLGAVDAKYVRITFVLSEEGRVDTFGLYGERTRASGLSNAMMAKRTGDSGVRFMMLDYALDPVRSGVVMVSPGEDLAAAQQMADGDMGTSYAFKTTDLAPMAVIDLGESRALTRVNASFKAGPGRLDIYLVPDPRRREGKAPAAGAPDGTGAGESRTIEEVVAKDFPGARAPVLAVDTGRQPGLNRVGANIDKLTGRYLVMMFHPIGAPVTAEARDFKDRDFKDIDSESAAQTGSTQPLEVAEITSYGNAPSNRTATTSPNTPPLLPATAPKPSGPVSPPIFPPSSGGGTITP